MPKESAIELMDFNPFLGPLLDSDDPRPSENRRIKERFKSYLSIGFYRDLDQPDGLQMRYYLFEDRHKPIGEIRTYLSLVELEQALQADADRKDIFLSNPKVFIEGHGGDDRYGVGGDHPRREAYRSYLEHPDIPTDASEQIHGENFDKIINDLRDVIRPKPGELFITLEACNSDNVYLGKSLWGHEKTFLERLSESHQDITFSGTGPWDPSHSDAAITTGTRAPGGVNTPIMSMGGNVWKAGNTIVFYNRFTVNSEVSDYQVVVRKSPFASTGTAKELKINTVKYACEILEATAIDADRKEVLIIKICASRDVLKIEDLKSVPGFPQVEFEGEKITRLIAEEATVLEKEKNNYIHHVQEILARAKSGEKFTDRDLLIIVLGLKDLSVFEGHEEIRDEILVNKNLLSLLMVTCGKVLIAGPSNNGVIDLLLENGIDINSVDERGMSALHYAVQNFYIYREEPLALVRKLLDCGADVGLADQKGVTPYMIARKHGSKEIVHGGAKLIELVQERLQRAASSHAVRSLMASNLGFFRRIEDEYLAEHRHDNPRLQHEYDSRFGLVLKK